MNAKRLMSFVLTLMMCIGLFSSVVLSASAAAAVYIIDPSGTDGASGSISCGGDTVNGTVYTSYAAFEAAYSGSAADVYFTAGEFGGLTVTKSVNIYGAKKGVDPNVKGSDKLQPWTLNSERTSGETVFTDEIRVASSVTGNVTIDGITVDEAGYFQVDCSNADNAVVIRNIVVGENCSRTDFFINASPAVNVVPSAGNYYMDFTLQNVYAGNYKGTGHFIYFIAAQNTTLDNIYFSNNKATFLQTSAASRVGDRYVMKNSFLYNNQPVSDLTIWHRFPSIGMTESITYTDNVFFNAHGTTAGRTNSHTIWCGEIKNLTQYYTFTGNTFVTEYGGKAPVRIVASSATNGNNYDLANMVVKENNFIGYQTSLNTWDGSYGSASGIKTYVGKLDMSDNFTWRVDSINSTAEPVNSFSDEEDLRALTGMTPRTIDKGVVSNNAGPYYLNYDRTISSDMLRVADVDLHNASIDGTDIKGIITGSYVPKFTYTCGNDIARTMTIKNSAGVTVSSIEEAGTYTVTLGYEEQSRDYTLTVAKAVLYTGDGYMFDPTASGNTARYWDGKAQLFTYGQNIFSDLTDLFAKADADGAAVPKVLLPAGEMEGDYTLTHSCEIVGYKHGVNPIVRDPKPTRPDTLSADRGTDETVLKGCWTARFTEDNMTYIFDGITIAGDGRFADSDADRKGESISYKNIICAPGALSAATKTNVRFYNSACSEKALNYQNIYMDGLKVQGSASDYQLFLFNGTDTVADNIYIANTELAVCSNIFFQSGKDYTKGLSFTFKNSKLYNNAPSSLTSAYFATYYGNQSHSYYRYADRAYVKTVIKDNLIYNTGKADQSNPYSNAIFNLRYPYPCFSYEITGNTFVESREVYHFLTDDKHLGTDVFNQFLHFVPMNQGKSEVNYQINLADKINITGNRFIGRDTVINADLVYAASLPTADNNFIIGYEAVQAMDSVEDIYTAVGQNPYEAINTKGGFAPKTYYLDYAMTTLQTALVPAKGTADAIRHVVTLNQSEGTLTAADFAPEGAVVKLYSDASRKQETGSIDCAALTPGTHVYYLTLTKDGVTDVYTLLLHTAVSTDTYAGGILYNAALDGLPDGYDVFAQMGKTVYHFVTGQTAFGDMDDIVTYTQTDTPTVLLPNGSYTADELSVVEDVNYIYDENALYDKNTTAKKKKIKVLCVGDSITLGTGASNRTTKAYPAQLQELLGDDYEVLNYGRGGALGSNSAQYGYRSLWNYDLSLQEAPDVVILAFGANDAQNGYYHVPLEYFKEEMLDMIKAYQNLPSHPIVYMTTTTNIIGGWNQEWLTELRAIQRDTAQTAGITLLDAYSMSLTWGDNSEIFSDNCHFKDAGYQKMAADFKAAIDWTQKGAHLPTDDISITFTAYSCPHVPGELIVDTPATCYQNGVGHKNCTLCGKLMESNVVISATGKHVYADTLTAGETTHYYACTTEGCPAKKDETAHKAELIADTPATCYQNGVGHTVCELCGKALESNVVINATGKHVFADTLTAGETTHYYACTTEGCPAKKDETAHKAELIADTPATCGTNGVGHRACEVCGKLMESNVVINATGKHTWDKGTITKQPTQTAPGVKTYTCTVCGATKTETVPALGADALTVFKDIGKKDWFVKNGSINFVYNMGLFTGTTPTTFGPNENMTRAMFVTVLGRLHGVKADKNAKTAFTDVKKDYYTGYVKWASDNGIVNGTSATTFSPNANVTREQICAMMVRYCNFAGIRLKKVNAAITFKDASKISGYARAAVKACQQGGIVNGEASGNGYNFRPQGKASRAEVATIMMNFYNNYVK